MARFFASSDGDLPLRSASSRNMVGIIKAQVENKSPEWDLVETTLPESLRLKAMGYLAPIKYDADIRADLPAAILDEHVAPRMFTAQVLAWNSKVFKGNA